MRIILLGGAGDMGSRAVEDLASMEGVRQITIADRNAEAGERIAGRLKEQKAAVDVRRIDANDHNDLVSAMRGYDVAASTLGPFHRFEAKLVRAAIDAGVDYASVCDEWEAAEAVFVEFSEEARQKGRIILTGLGTSPGLTNVGVRYLADGMSRVRGADIYVYQPLDAGGGEALVRHMLHIISGNIAVWRDGRRVTLPACIESRLVDFPRFGSVQTWNMGHSEPVTLPRFITEIEKVNFFMGFGRGSGWFIKPAQMGWWKRQGLVDWAVRFVLKLERQGSGKLPSEGAVRIDVWGEQDGQEVHRMLCGTGQMRKVTGLSLAVGACMLGRKELITREPGVYAPEGCIDPQMFIHRLKKNGLAAYEDLAMTHPLG
ncbi:MAG: saccharopine dehydrogenase NADP-binding domain-containing protein [Acidobacteria bacterium]|nr:saccharopine dehydrogenase NADP-binding domain-containing protein [Acidobacteriota bacterium]MBI3658644.1 saccharopine dehydrogenase NADP-binding domain-containing protein [Acidobacteriota bacterium]